MISALMRRIKKRPTRMHDKVGVHCRDLLPSSAHRAWIDVDQEHVTIVRRVSKTKLTLVSLKSETRVTIPEESRSPSLVFLSD